MAVARCISHPPRGRTRSYSASVEPIGYPETAMVCGVTECSEPGMIWLEEVEKAAYDRGERIFQAFTASMECGRNRSFAPMSPGSRASYAKRFERKALKSK